jgi:L-threonylcarbamoyladenylate synthase
MPYVSLIDCVAGLRAGTQVATFPTDTVPALAVRPDRAELIFSLKQRSLDKPLILMAGDAADLWPYIAGDEAERAIWQTVAAAHWPGALTLVLPASDRLPPTLNPKDPTSIGIRVPAHGPARALLRRTGPLATTSANRSGQPALLSQDEILTQFPGVLALPPEELGTLETSFSATESGGTVISPDGPEERAAETRSTEPSAAETLSAETSSAGASSAGTPSTVVRWTGTGWDVLRQGAVVLDLG